MPERDVSSAEADAVQLEIVPRPAANARVAVVILAAVAIAATLGYLLTGAGTKIFSAHTTLTTLVPDAAGVVTGSEVRLSGIPIGNVTNVRISEYPDSARMVRVDMKVDQRFLKDIPSDSQAVVTEDNLLGGQYLAINAGKSKATISENATLASVPVKQAADQADIIKAFQSELQQADDLFTQMSSPTTPIGAVVMGSKEYDQLMVRISAFDKSMRSLASQDSTIGSALFSEKLYTETRKSITDVDKSLESIQKGEGVTGRLFASDTQYNDFLKQLQGLHKSLADINAGKSGMLHDDVAYRKISDLLKQTDGMIDSLTTGPGTTARLMRDRELYDSLTKELRSMQVFLADLRTNPQKYLRYQRKH
jgi:phospholipid/cholesterol/gamma-HCH transport system substrate-binding protein